MKVNKANLKTAPKQAGAIAESVSVGIISNSSVTIKQVTFKLIMPIFCSLACPDIPILGANLLFGTPPCDGNSLMDPNNSNNTFTDYDNRAARMLYPISGAPAPSITSIVTATCGNHCRVWTAYIANPFPWYTFRLRLKNTATNQFVKVGNVTAGNSAYTALSYNVAGNYVLQVLGSNYQGDITCYSANYAVVIP